MNDWLRLEAVLILAAVIGCSKVLHEIGHALSCKHFGGECHQIGPMLLVFNHDVPGVIGALGTTLGKSGVNISRMTVGREEESNQNIILLSTDELVSKELLGQVQMLENITNAQVLDLTSV